jgi:opacity protein-like surface antigen
MKNHFFVGLANALGLTLIAVILVLFAVSAFAGDYIGIQAGQSIGHVPNPEALVMQSFTLDERAEVGRLSVGHDGGWWGIEAGYMPRLSERDSHAVGTRPEGDFDIHQDISTHAFDIRGRLGLQLSSRLTASLFAGAAYVTSENHEYGFNTNDHAPTEWRNTMTQLAPEVGIGLSYRVTDRIAITAEVSEVPHIAQSHWTGYSDVTMALLGIQVSLP